MRDMARILYNILCDVSMVEDIQYIGNAAYINLEDGDVLKISLNSSNENHVFDKIKLRFIKRDLGTLDICYLEFKEYFSPVRIGRDYFLSPAVKKNDKGYMWNVLPNENELDILVEDILSYICTFE